MGSGTEGHLVLVKCHFGFFPPAPPLNGYPYICYEFALTPPPHLHPLSLTPGVGYSGGGVYRFVVPPVELWALPSGDPPSHPSGALQGNSGVAHEPGAEERPPSDRTLSDSDREGDSFRTTDPAAKSARLVATGAIACVGASGGGALGDRPPGDPVDPPPLPPPVGTEGPRDLRGAVTWIDLVADPPVEDRDIHVGLFIRPRPRGTDWYPVTRDVPDLDNPWKPGGYLLPTTPFFRARRETFNHPWTQLQARRRLHGQILHPGTGPALPPPLIETRGCSDHVVLV